MKKIKGAGLAIIAAVFFSGCAINQQQQAYNAKMQEIHEWLGIQKQEVKAGRKPRSQVFSEYYDRVMAAPSGPLDIPIMKYASHMVKTARSFEGGQITREQYDDDDREEMTTLDQRIQEVQHQTSMEDQARRQAAAAMYLQMRPRMTNCSVTGMYGSCTTY